MLLTACDERLAAEAPERFRWAWSGVMVLSLLIGLLLVNVWGQAWALFRDYLALFTPTAATVGVFVLWPHRRGVAALAKALGGRDATVSASIAALLVVVLALGFLRLTPSSVYGETELPWWIAWARPDHSLYRVLLLMPLWGGWAMLIVGQFRRPDDGTEPAVAAFVRGCGPVAAAACMGAVLVATILYFRFLPWTQLSISGAAALAAIAGGLVLARLTGGLKRSTLLATNVLTQLAFLFGYIANH